MKSFPARVYEWLENSAMKQKNKEYRRRFSIHQTARLGYLPHIVFMGNIEIGAHSYFNSGYIKTGENSKVTIGKWCAIGYNVSIQSISNSIEYPSSPDNPWPAREGSICIGDHVWIGSNVSI